MAEEQLAVSSVPTVKETRPVVIRVKNLYKIYRVGDIKVRALDGLDFDIYKGEFVAIVGASGSGKSTLLNMLAGLEKPTKGEIEIGRVHIEKMTERQLVSFRREKVGFIFQAYNLLNTMNALENVALPLSFRGVSRRQRLKEARKYMDLVGVGGQARHMPNQMSGGQQLHGIRQLPWSHLHKCLILVPGKRHIRVIIPGDEPLMAYSAYKGARVQHVADIILAANPVYLF